MVGNRAESQSPLWRFSIQGLGAEKRGSQLRRAVSHDHIETQTSSLVLDFVAKYCLTDASGVMSKDQQGRPGPSSRAQGISPYISFRSRINERMVTGESGSP